MTFDVCFRYSHEGKVLTKLERLKFKSIDEAVECVHRRFPDTIQVDEGTEFHFFDWFDCWSSAPPPCLATISVPAGLKLPRSESGTRVLREIKDNGSSAVTSPMVGRVYTRRSAEEEQFVKVGDQVQPDTVVCVIEAMKVFTEIFAQTQGTVTAIRVADGECVEWGQTLLQIQRSD